MDGGGWFWVLVAIAVGCYSLFAPESWRYEITYRVPAERVSVQGKPTDCEWLHAPLGDKACDYKASVYGFNRAGDLVLGELAPKYSIDSRNLPIVSYDSGKTWTWSSKPDLKLWRISVVWQKTTRP